MKMTIGKKNLEMIKAKGSVSEYNFKQEKSAGIMIKTFTEYTPEENAKLSSEWFVAAKNGTRRKFAGMRIKLHTEQEITLDKHGNTPDGLWTPGWIDIGRCGAVYLNIDNDVTGGTGEEDGETSEEG